MNWKIVKVIFQWFKIFFTPLCILLEYNNIMKIKLMQFFHIEPCTTTFYDVGTVTYDRYSQMGHNILQTWFDISNITQKATEGSSNLFINYQSMEMKVSQKVRILNEASFISSVGGNLGLFIGFSFLDSLFVIFQWVCTYLNTRVK